MTAPVSRMAPVDDPVVIVGTGIAGLTCAETLRHEGFDGRVLLIGDESHHPYDRPPLSKQVLSGAWDPARVLLRTDAELDALGIELILGTAAVGLDPGSRRVSLADGSVIRYRDVVIATGVRPRPWVGAGAKAGDGRGPLTLHTLDDAEALREVLESGGRVVVIGGGFVGTEVAAAARSAGVDVTLAHRGALPLSVLGPEVGRHVAHLHRSRGVHLRAHSEVVGLGGDRRGWTVEFSDGDALSADSVVAAIGSAPCTDWLIGSGLGLDDGVDCDVTGLVRPGVWAAGDVARRPDGDRRVRIEHRTNAVDAAIAVARGITGRPTPIDPIPYFWTDQYDTRIQVYGLPRSGAARIDRDPDEGRFLARYGSDTHPHAVLAWNLPREIHAARSELLPTAR